MSSRARVPLPAHGDEKYASSQLLCGPAEWDLLRVEHRRIESGSQNCVRPECTELVYILSGHATVRRTGDGKRQVAVARPGTSWLVPAGTHETQLELDGSTECLLIFLPDKLLADSALADYGINPTQTQLAYAGGFSDTTLSHIGGALHQMMSRDAQAVDRILADGLRTTLAAHLLGNYTVERWTPVKRTPSLDARRLQRVLEFIDARLGDDLSLADLAREACLSPFHFARLFSEATGQSPHRYLTLRRVTAAQKLLASEGTAIAQVALDTGFGSQASFARAFRKVTGLTAADYREQHRAQRHAHSVRTK